MVGSKIADEGEGGVGYVNQSHQQVAVAVVGLTLLLILTMCICFCTGIVHIFLPIPSTYFSC